MNSLPQAPNPLSQRRPGRLREKTELRNARGQRSSIPRDLLLASAGGPHNFIARVRANEQAGLFFSN